MHLNNSIKSSILDVLWRNATHGIAVLSREGNFISVSPSLCRLLEYTEPELLRKTFEDITHPEDLEDDLLLAREVADGHRQQYTMWKRYLTKSNGVIPVILTVVPVKNGDGEFELFLSQIDVVVSANPETVLDTPKLSTRLFHKSRVNASFVLAGLAAIAYLAAEVVKHLKE